MDNSITFFKLWRNIIIRKVIIQYLQYFNLFYQTQTFSIYTFKQFHWKSYLRSIELEFDRNNKDEILQFINQLPSNINCLVLRNLDYMRDPTFKITDSEDFNSLSRSISLKTDIPPTITQFTFDQYYNIKITDLESNQSNLEYLEFGKFYNESLEIEGNEEGSLVSILPSNLKVLKFHLKSLFNQELKLSLPNKLETVVFGMLFNQVLKKGILPDSITDLEFGYKYNQVIGEGVLPKNLKRLRINSAFNQIIGNEVLPDSLEILLMGTDYDKPLPILPKSLKQLSFYSASLFNQPISKEIFCKCNENLTKLEFGFAYQQISNLSKGVIANSVKHLKLGGWISFASYLNSNGHLDIQKSIPIGVLSNNILNLKIDPSYVIKKGSIPSSVTKLEDCNFKFLKLLSSPKLLKLKLSDDFNERIRQFDIPNTVTSLDLGNQFNQIITANSLPTGLKKLKFSTHYNQPLNYGSLPTGITSLNLGYSFSNPIIWFPPINLKILDFGNDFNIPFCKLEFQIPNSLVSLKFGNLYNQCLDLSSNDGGCHLPNLKVLEIGRDFTQPISSLWLPKSLKFLIIKSTDSYFQSPLPTFLNNIFIFNSNSKFLKNPINESIFLDNPSFILNTVKIVSDDHKLFSKFSKNDLK